MRPDLAEVLRPTATRGQVVHLDLTEAEWLGLNRGAELDPAVALLRRLRGALSRGLGDLTGAIVVHEVSIAPEGFDARFSALWRRYSYRIADGPAHWDPLGRYDTLCPALAPSAPRRFRQAARRSFPSGD